MKDLTFQVLVDGLNSKIEWISNKFFNRFTHEEIKNINQYILHYAQDPINHVKLWLRPNDVNDLKNTLITNGDPMGEWYPLPILEEAKTIDMPFKDDLCYPLDLKQAIIISRLLFHPLDPKIFITTGIGGSGKSTYLNLIKQIYDNDVASVSLTNLSNEFQVAVAVTHRLIASDEIGKGSNDEEVLKKLSAKNNICINPKNRQPIETKTQSALFYCCNESPVFNIKDTGIIRRIVFYQRNKKIANPKEGMDVMKYSKEDLLKVVRYCWEIDKRIVDNKINFFDYFQEETHQELMKKNSIYLSKATKYDEYVKCCLNSHYKNIYAENNFYPIKEMFNKWQIEDKQLKYDYSIFEDIEYGELPF